jgi:hypothetical protein
MQGHDAYAECARNLALQLSLRRQVTCLRELGGDLRLRVSVGGGLQTCLALARATSDPYTRLSLLTIFSPDDGVAIAHHGERLAVEVRPGSYAEECDRRRLFSDRPGRLVNPGCRPRDACTWSGLG